MNSNVFWHVAVALAISVAMVPIAMRLGRRFGLLDHPGKHKRHKAAVPFGGGPALFVVYWVTVLLLGTIFGGSSIGDSTLVVSMLGGAAVIFLVGLVDDLRPLSAPTKLLAQGVAGIVLILGGLTIDPLYVPFFGKIALGKWSAVITLLWVVGLTNAINLIDGLDGLAAGVSLIAAVTLTILGVIYKSAAVIAVAGTLVGFLVVFLYYNRHPARIFLGDSGSLQLGYYFAVVSLLVPFKSYTAAALYLPLLALGVPILETGISIARRLATGKRVMSADRRHLFHYLALAGLKPNQVVGIFWGVSLIFAASTLAMFLWDRVLVTILLGVFMVVIFVAFLIFTANLPRVRKESPKNEPRGSR